MKVQVIQTLPECDFFFVIFYQLGSDNTVRTEVLNKEPE